MKNAELQSTKLQRRWNNKTAKHKAAEKME